MKAIRFLPPLLPLVLLIASCTGTSAPSGQEPSSAVQPVARSEPSLRFVRLVHARLMKSYAVDSWAELSLGSDAGQVTLPVETIDGRSFVGGFQFRIEMATPGADRWEDQQASVGSDALPPDKLVVALGEAKTFYVPFYPSMDSPQSYDLRICVSLEDEGNREVCSQAFRMK